ncbi:MAG: DUF1249 domain-containing protein [Gammaproteobacteria bacterium]|nr:DUF1249 domain-containing protein [Gammaproteobacteria bacterium]
MLNDQHTPSHLQACNDIHKESFAALMDLYENNYLRLKKLIPGMSEINGAAVSTVFGCLDLHLCILEQSKFTTLLSLSYYFEREQALVREPNLQIRVYHDVALAEVLSGELHHGKLRLKKIPETAIIERWHLNRFLYKWLGFCLHIGHGFERSGCAKNVNHRMNQLLSAKLSS